MARYENAFRRRIYRGLKTDDSRLFIGVGSDYKALFLEVLLMHLEENAAKNYLKKRLGIAAISSELEVKLKRPFNAKARLKAFDVDEFDPLRTDTRYWGADKVTQEFIDELIAVQSRLFQKMAGYSRFDRGRLSLIVGLACPILNRKKDQKSPRSGGTGVPVGMCVDTRIF